MTTPPNPRDLTDADIDAIFLSSTRNRMPRGATGGDWTTHERIVLEGESLREFARGIEARLAADREARPAPASVGANLYEALEAPLERLVDLCNTGFMSGSEEVTSAEAALERLYKARLAAASTPPAEAQPVAWEYRFFDDANPPGKWTEWERVQPRNKYMSTVMDAVREFQHYISEGYRYELRALYEGPIPVTPPASEARATGDAADGIDELLRRVVNAAAACRGGNMTFRERDAIVAEARAALSDRSTGAVPAGPKPCSVGVNGGRKEVILAFHTMADALAWSDAMIGSASAPAAPPVAPGEGCYFEHRGSWVAATGAAGEPQPREVPVSADLVAFLNGAAPLEGVWFGEKNPNERGMFWWRKRLPEVQQADSGAAGGQGDSNEA